MTSRDNNGTRANFGSRNATTSEIGDNFHRKWEAGTKGVGCFLDSFLLRDIKPRDDDIRFSTNP
jgi:hypothetical protein